MPENYEYNYKDPWIDAHSVKNYRGTPKNPDQTIEQIIGEAIGEALLKPNHATEVIQKTVDAVHRYYTKGIY